MSASKPNPKALAPDAKIDDPPERKIDRATPFEHVARQRPNASCIHEVGVATQGRFDAVQHETAERAPEPNLFRRGEAELITALPHGLGQDPGHTDAQDALGIAPDYFMTVAEAKQGLVGLRDSKFRPLQVSKP